MDLLINTSLVAAFIAGVAALFAPCCITVLLPSYLGSIFRERRLVFLMTFIFFLGILTVFLPLGLGSAAFGQFLSKYHTPIFTIGGSFLLLLGLSMLLGFHYSLPFRVNPTLQQHHAGAVFTLGIFSGIATTCCAPVLAGVLALSVLPGSLFWGGMYTLSYVLGMVAPLFLLALFLDRTKLTQRFMGFRKQLTYSIGPRAVRLSLAETISGITFVVMGILIISLALTNRLAVHSSSQLEINIMLTKIFQKLEGVIKTIPEPIWALVFISFLIIMILRVRLALNRKDTYEKQ